MLVVHEMWCLACTYLEKSKILISEKDLKTLPCSQPWLFPWGGTAPLLLLMCTDVQRQIPAFILSPTVKGVSLYVGAQHMLVVLAGSQTGIYWVHVVYTSVKTRIPKNSLKRKIKSLCSRFISGSFRYKDELACTGMYGWGSPKKEGRRRGVKVSEQLRTVACP